MKAMDVIRIGRSRTRLAVCNLAGDILVLSDLDQEVGTGPDDLMPDVVKRLEALLDESGHPADTVHGVGLSLPGTVDQMPATWFWHVQDGGHVAETKEAAVAALLDYAEENPQAEMR